MVEQITHAFVLCLPSAGKQCYACVLLKDFLFHCADMIIVAGAYSAVPSQIEPILPGSIDKYLGYQVPGYPVPGYPGRKAYGKNCCKQL